MDKASEDQSRINELWRVALMGDDPSLHRVVRLFRVLPASPRCKVCRAPFGGPGAYVMRAIGRGPSKMNPRLCGVCEHFAQEHPGGAEIPVSLLFADIRGSTPLAETLGTKRFSELIARFYNAAAEELVKEDGWVDRLIGDEAVGLFVPGVAGSRHAEAAVKAAQGILKATGHEDAAGPWVPVGVGVHTGNAFVGAVGSGGVSDITALGDDVNLAARLAAAASAGEVLITEGARAAAGLGTGGLELRHLELKGRSEPIDVWRMLVGPTAPVVEHSTQTT